MKWIRLVVMWSMCVLVLLAPNGGAIEGDERWMEVQDNTGWVTPENLLGPPNMADATCSLDGFGCFEYGWVASPIGVVPEAIEIVTVEISFHVFSATLGNLDDRFELSWGIGDVGHLNPPVVWTIVDVIIGGSAPTVRIFNITEDFEWTMDDIANLYLQIQGIEGPMGPDDLDIFWDASSIRYEYRVIADPVIPPDENGGEGGPTARNIWDILAMLLIMLFVLLLIYLFMKWTQDRFEREVP